MVDDSSPPPSEEALSLALSQSLRSRAVLIQRLSDVVCWPTTRIPPHERELAGDVLVGLLRQAPVELRIKCATRLATLQEAPKLLLRWLARDEIAVAQPLLTQSPALDDSDLIATIRATPKKHWLAIVERRRLNDMVAEALIRTHDPQTALAVVRNDGAKLSNAAVDACLHLTREDPAIAEALIRRVEVRPAQALTMFWWCDHGARLSIIKRFGADRAVLIHAMAEVFAIAASERWEDMETRKALRLIERRQRNRAAAERSPYGSLEGATVAAERGVDKAMALEISHMAGRKPMTGARILTDTGGEPLAILCKATGIKREVFVQFWKALRRPYADAENPTSPLGRALLVYDTIATAKAQTVLRYWNWSLSTERASANLDPDDDSLEFSPASRAAALVLNRRG
jgi:uncharacterized protein (DUF2336 family)